MIIFFGLMIKIILYMMQDLFYLCTIELVGRDLSSIKIISDSSD